MRLRDLPEFFDTTGKRTVPDIVSHGWRTVQWGTRYDDDHHRHPGAAKELFSEVERTRLAIAWLEQHAGPRGEAWELYGLWLWIIRDPEIAEHFKGEFVDPWPDDL